MKFPYWGGVKEGVSAKQVNQWLKRMALGSVALAVVPLQFLDPFQVETVQSQATWQTSYSLAEQSPELLTDATPVVTIEKTTSRYQEEQARLAAEARKREEAARKQQEAAQAAANTSLACRELTESEKHELIERASAAYGIPYSLLRTVWQVESGERSCTQVRSYAGATGPFQFMPGTWRGYAVDGNGDGVKNINDARDAAFAAAKLLAANGANRGDYARAAFAYNRAQWYVDKVLTRAGLK